MKNILTESGFEMLQERFGSGSLYHKTIHLQGIGESYLSDRIKDLELNLSENGIGVAYLPSPGIVRLRLTGTSANSDKIKIQEFIDGITKRLPQYVYGDGMDSLSEVIGTILTSRSLSVGTAESCTGGAIAKEIVSVAGSSKYFKGGIVSYSNEIKINVLGVNEDDIDQFGAVSEDVVNQMAKNGRTTLNVDYCLATSGIAGPDGGTLEKPVGSLWIAIAGPKGVETKKFHFGDDRGRNIQIAVLTALNLLRCELLKINTEKS
jgi:nicotinamide-nucleotide amidase